MAAGSVGPVLRAKMRVNQVLQSKDSNGATESEIVKLSAVTGGEGTENHDWSRWTPYATFEITITNPVAFGQLSRGHEFYVDFTPAE